MYAKKGKKNVPQVYVLTDKVNMRFRPENTAICQSHIENGGSGNGFINKVTRIFNFGSPLQPIGNGPQDDGSDAKSQKNESGTVSNASLPIKFVVRLSTQHVLIGNSSQLDLIGVSNISKKNFVDTDYFWSLRFQDEITSVGVDSKKLNVLSIIAGHNLIIYKYDSKKLSKQRVPPFQIINLSETPLFMSVAKDSNICVFYQKRMEIYLVGDHVRKRLSKKYQLPWNAKQDSFKIFRVPEPYESVLNIFFEEVTESQTTFALWCIQLEFMAAEIRSAPIQKIYEIKNSLKPTLQLKNYSKDLYLMNLGSEILAVKRGFILDSATVNIKQAGSYLKYVGNETLLHLSNQMIEVYHFSLNTHVKPNRIIIKPKDSIKIYQQIPQMQFLKVLPILNNDYILFYQTQAKRNKMLNGQVKYCFFITRSISRQDKINQLFPKGDQQIELGSPQLVQKCDMAEKMGLSVKEIYLQLWNRTKKSTKRDYRILIATNDYQTIKEQVLKKLKKASMTFKQIQTIEKDCYVMLENRVFSPQCTEDSVMEYISCHFFLRKLELFKETELLDRDLKAREGKVLTEDERIIRMTIRQYQNLKSMQIKAQLMEMVGQLCHEGKQKLTTNIRLLLKNFKFVFRTIYDQILQQMIIKSGDRLLELLSSIPEILPYLPKQQSESEISVPVGLYQGVWPDINQRQWQQSLFIDSIMTIDNKQIILQKVIKSLCFRRNWLSQHDMVTVSKKQIQSTSQRIKSQRTFYFFIAKIFEHIKNQHVQKGVIQFLQANYDLMPIKIKRRIFLSKTIYSYFKSKNLLPLVNGKSCSLSQFLNFEDYQLIRHCFEQQRSIKGLILKQVKPLFEQVCGEQQGNEMFNKSLLNYFISDLSQVSDLKYILNRINNEKLEFHRKNQKMYEILVQALQRKLKIGTDNDIPIEEVLIYIENIPLRASGDKQEQNRALIELKVVETINSQVELLQDAKLNMSIYDILHNSDEVFSKLIDYQLKSNHIFTPHFYRDSIQVCKQIEQFTYSTIARLQNLSEDIYNRSNSFTIFFIFITKLCEEAELIKHVKILLSNKHMRDKCYDETTAENLVQYMSRWKMYEHKIMTDNQYYINQLLKLIPEQCDMSLYMKRQMEYAKIFSQPQSPYEYPIAQDAYTINNLRDQFQNLSVSFILSIDIEHLYEVINSMQTLTIKNMEDQQSQSGQAHDFGFMNFITKHQIYQIIIIKLLATKHLKQALHYMHQILSLQIANTQYNIIYPILFIIQMTNQLNQEHKKMLVDCISYYFYSPKDLLNIIEHLVSRPLNTKQIKQFLEQSLENQKKSTCNFNADNEIIRVDYLDNLNSPEMKEMFMESLKKVTIHMQDCKEEFKNIKYAAIMAMLCNSPYALSKFIHCSERVNVNAIRSFLSYAIREELFDPLAVLELGKRIFEILFIAEKEKRPIETVIQEFNEHSLLEEIEIAGFGNDTFLKSNDVLAKFRASAKAFERKKMAEKAKMKEQLSVLQRESQEQKSERVKKNLKDSSQIDRKDPSSYPFVGFDNDNESDDYIQLRDTFNQKNKSSIAFHADLERSEALQRNKKGGVLFLSTRQQFSKGGNSQFSISIKGPTFKTCKDKNFSSIRSSQKPSNSNLQESTSNVHLTQSHKLKMIRPQSEGDGKSEKSQNFSNKRSEVQKFEIESIDIEQNSSEVDSEIKFINPHENVNQLAAKDQYGSCSRQLSEVSDNYEITIKSVKNQSSIEINENSAESRSVSCGSIDKDKTDKVESMKILEEQQQYVMIAKKIIEMNPSLNERTKRTYDLSLLQQYTENKQAICCIAAQIYQNCKDNKLSSIFQLIIQIGQKHPISNINQQSINILLKIEAMHDKILNDIPLQSLLPANQIINTHHTKLQVYEIMYPNLQRIVDSQNIQNIGLFVRRAFGDANLEGQIIWNFMMSLSEKLENFEKEDIERNLQKIQGIISKVNIGIWLTHCDVFIDKVLKSAYKDKLLAIFCNYLSIARPKDKAKQFLMKIAEADDDPIIQKTIQQFRSYWAKH